MTALGSVRASYVRGCEDTSHFTPGAWNIILISILNSWLCTKLYNLNLINIAGLKQQLWRVCLWAYGRYSWLVLILLLVLPRHTWSALSHCLTDWLSSPRTAVPHSWQSDWWESPWRVSSSTHQHYWKASASAQDLRPLYILIILTTIISQISIN